MNKFVRQKTGKLYSRNINNGCRNSYIKSKLYTVSQKGYILARDFAKC